MPPALLALLALAAPAETPPAWTVTVEVVESEDSPTARVHPQCAPDPCEVPPIELPGVTRAQLLGLLDLHGEPVTVALSPRTPSNLPDRLGAEARRPVALVVGGRGEGEVFHSTLFVVALTPTGAEILHHHTTGSRDSGGGGAVLHGDPQFIREADGEPLALRVVQGWVPGASDRHMRPGPPNVQIVRFPDEE